MGLLIRIIIRQCLEKVKLVAIPSTTGNRTPSIESVANSKEVKMLVIVLTSPVRRDLFLEFSGGFPLLSSRGSSDAGIFDSLLGSKLLSGSGRTATVWFPPDSSTFQIGRAHV